LGGKLPYALTEILTNTVFWTVDRQARTFGEPGRNACIADIPGFYELGSTVTAFGP
jgi:hypothetical protein